MTVEKINPKPLIRVPKKTVPFKVSKKIDRYVAVKKGTKNVVTVEQRVRDEIKWLKHRDRLFRYFAAKNLALLAVTHSTKMAAAVLPLTEALKDRDWWVILMSATALGRIGKSAKSATPQLKELMKHWNSNVRKAAVKALHRIGVKVVGMQEWVNGLYSKDPKVRLKAVRSLADFGSAAAATLANVLKKDKDAGMRLEAVRSLEKMGKEARDVIHTLRKAAEEDGSPKVRRASKKRFTFFRTSTLRQYRPDLLIMA